MKHIVYLLVVIYFVPLTFLTIWATRSSAPGFIKDFEYPCGFLKLHKCVCDFRLDSNYQHYIKYSTHVHQKLMRLLGMFIKCGNFVIS